MPLPDFHSSKLKVERAAHHVKDLQACLAAFLKTDFYRLRAEMEPDTGRHVVQLEAVKPMPVAIPLIIGDAVNNLRSALDHLWSAIHRSAGVSDTRSTFPMHETRENLINTINNGPIKRFAPDVCDLIVDEVKPYAAGNHAIWALGKLANLDKHRLLIPVIAVTRLSNVSLKGEEPSSGSFSSAAIDSGMRLYITWPARKLRVTDYGQPSFDVLFGKGQFFENESVVPTLEQLTQLVSGVVEVIEAHYFGKGAP